jgi:hypothetical protein
MIFNIVQGENSGRAKSVSCTSLDNFYPEVNVSGKSKSVSALIGCPGYRTVSELYTTGYTRCKYTTSTERLFEIVYNRVYEMSVDEVYTLRGTINTFSGSCSISDNGVQLLIVDGTNGYTYNLSTNTLAVITDINFPPGATVSIFTDGYFLVNESNTGRFWFSTLYDGASWNGLDFATAEYSADILQGITKTSNGTIWMIGKRTVELWQNVGIDDLPWRRIQGAVKEAGCSAPDSIASNGDQVFWLGYGANGHGSIYMGSGYESQKISTHAIEYQIKQYSNIDAADSFCYSDEGHSFYVINFGSEATLVYDITTGEWHKRSTYNYDTGESARQSSRCYTFFNGKHYVGNYVNCKSSEMNLDIYTDNGLLIKRAITTNHINDENRMLQHLKLEIELEKGIGLNNEDAPEFEVLFSNDNGNTWIYTNKLSAGSIGEFTNRAILRRLGSARDRVYRLVFTDSGKWIISTAFIEVK